MSMYYYVLFVKLEGKWSPEFGDEKRSVVAQEAKDSYDGYLTKIVRTDGTQEATESAQYKLNVLQSAMHDRQEMYEAVRETVSRCTVKELKLELGVDGAWRGFSKVSKPRLVTLVTEQRIRDFLDDAESQLAQMGDDYKPCHVVALAKDMAIEASL